MTTDPTPAATLAALIWEASRRDEGTISALGADVVAAHLLREVPGLGDALTANGPGAGRGTIAAPADTARPLPAYVDVVMTQGPSAEGEFVELEDPDGRSVGQDIGVTWIHTASDDFWRLRIPLTAPRDDAARDELVNALRLTVWPLDTETLRPLPGWSWWDALSKHAPDVAAALVRDLPTTGTREQLTADAEQTAPAPEPVRYEYVLLLPDGRRVGSGPTLAREAVVSDHFAWGQEGVIHRRPVNGWEPDPDGVPSPRIPEPGTWGVVEAACVHTANRFQWVHDPDGYWHQIGGPNAPDDWDSLIDPVLVREGTR